jgi:hypothetical protein
MYQFQNRRRLDNLDRPLGAGCGKFMGLTLGITCFALIILGFLRAPNLTTFSCLRGESSQFACELTSSGTFGTDKKLISSSQIQSAKVGTTRGYMDYYYYVILETTTEDIHIFSSFYNDEAQDTVARINTFMTDTKQKSLVLEKDDRGKFFLAVIIWGPIILFLGAFILYRITYR